jgi:glycosyltransferase involved in cell wall biosynthesis
MISIIIPVYNEEKNISLQYLKILKSVEPLNLLFEIIFINDGSSDDSESILAKITANDNRVMAINFKKNFGQTAALMAGIDHAKGEIIIPMDGDLQNDPADISRLLAKLDEGYDVVSGWRKNRQDHFIRVLPSKIANFLISKISGVSLHDYGCSLKAYRSDAIKNVKLYGEMHRFIPIYASWQGGKIAEIPVVHHARQYGSSKYGMNRILKVILDLLVVKFMANFSTKPIYVFGGVGVFCLLFSFLTIFTALFLKFFENTSLIQTPLPLLSVLLFMTGVICILMGLLAEIMMRTYHESQNKPVYLVKNIKKG